MSKGTVYLLHFEQNFYHARHYLGFAVSVRKRLWHHRNGTGAKLLRAVAQASINFECVRRWKKVDRHFERKLKKQKNAPRLCPVCNPRSKSNQRKERD
ncbi:MAG: endonuclease [Acidobacteriota bacterium]|nr:endonuclease [Acidobacteriota bacterium]